MQFRVLFVCLGNICRSPTAEAVFSKWVDDHYPSNSELEIELDSAGTGSWHIGKQPDYRAIAAGARRNYELGHLKARQLDVDDFFKFDLILAMDKENLADILELKEVARQKQASNTLAEVKLYLDAYGDGQVDEVPDPYYGGSEGFDYVLDLLEKGASNLLNDIQHKYSKP